MTIKIRVGDISKADDFDHEGKPVATIKLNVRRDLDGNYMIMDHGDIDIIVNPKKSKVTVFPKPDVRDPDISYDAQDRLFTFLFRKGIIDNDSVEGGNVSRSMEAKYYKSADSDISPEQAVLFTLGKFIEEEKPYYIFRQAQEEEELERMVNPDEEYSTELGEVPHSDEKGTIYPNDFPSGANYRVYESKLLNETKTYPLIDNYEISFHDARDPGKFGSYEGGENEVYLTQRDSGGQEIKTWRIRTDRETMKHMKQIAYDSGATDFQKHMMIDDIQRGRYGHTRVVRHPGANVRRPPEEETPDTVDDIDFEFDF